MSAANNSVDPGGLQEFSVVYTDRALNHMSQNFQGVMRDISAILKRAYGADALAIIPGGGTFAMEAVARQFAGGANCLVLRNGWFSFRWSQILDMAGIATATTVLKARQQDRGAQAPFAPAPIDEVVAAIRAQKPAVVFAPHVETASGILLPDDYLRAVGAATRDAGGLFVLDCIASGAVWVDMRAIGVDVLISAPQKGWSGPSCAGLVMLGERALARLGETTSSSFACDLKKWRQIMVAYETGGHAYHATMPTDALRRVRDAMRETETFGFDAGARASMAARPPRARTAAGTGVPQRRRGRLRSARRGGQLHHGSRNPVGEKVRRPGIPARRRRAAAMRRTGGFPQLPHRALRPRQAGRRGWHGGTPGRGLRPHRLSAAPRAS
jgi:aspartate aminotransferase-like enzyme